VGNLLLHLNGNLRQWVVAGVGNEAFQRHRAEEFAAREGQPASELLAALEATLADVDRILSQLTADRLAERCAIQGRDLTVLDAVFHVTEHFAYHLGQIILVAKMFAPGGVHFYEDAGGLARPLWHKYLGGVPVASALGFTIKSGWACAVVLDGPAKSPEVVASLRIELSDPSDAHGRQPYHAAAGTAKKPGPQLDRLIASIEA